MLSKVKNRSHHSPVGQPEKFSDRKQRIYNFLHENPVGVLSSVTPDGVPHGAVIYYKIDKKFGVSFLTKSQTRKYDNLKRNNHAMLTVFEPESQTTTQITGRAEEITDNYEINAIAGSVLGASLRTSEAGVPPISKLLAGDYAAFKITPVQIRMAVYSRPDPGEYSELFESIESFELEGRDT